MRNRFPIHLSISLALIGLTTISPAASAQPPDIPKPVDPIVGTVYGNEKLIPALIESLKDNDPEVRLYLATALAECGPEVVAPLIRTLSDLEPTRRASAAYALGQIGPIARTALPDLVGRLKDEDRMVRRQSAHAISRILTPERRLTSALTPTPTKPKTAPLFEFVPPPSEIPK